MGLVGSLAILAFGGWFISFDGLLSEEEINCVGEEAV
jgi:hypothetical protein